MKLFTSLIFSIAFFSISAQNTVQFRESQLLFLNKDSTRYLTLKGDSTVYLKINKKKSGKKYDLTGISKFKNDTTFHYSTNPDYDRIPFLPADFNLKNTQRLYGDFVQDNELIKFYPWKFKTKKGTRTTAVAKNDSLGKYTYYIIEIPERTVVKVKYRAFHYGALTLPVKFYTKSKDSVSNTQFGVNLNLMIGYKWGSKKYRYLSKEINESYAIATSVNFIAGFSELKLAPSNTDKSLTKDISVAALSTGFALGFQYKKIGIFFPIGLDIPLSEYGKDWVYKKTLWAGIGLGLGL